MGRGICRRLGAVLCTVAAMLWLFAATFMVYGAGKGSIEIECKTDDGPVIGLNMQIYRVGEFEDNTITLQGAFSGLQVYIPDLEPGSLQDAAYTLDTYAKTENITPTDKGIVYSDGRVLFEDLEDGVYLITGKRLSSGDKYYSVIPVLVEVKDGNAVGCAAKITVHLKTSVVLERYRILKVWDDGSSYNVNRPISIEVEIYKDGEYYETAVLNATNKWSYEWTSDNTSEWHVKEIDIHKDYKVVYRHNETQFLIINNRTVLANDNTSTSTTITTTTTTAKPTTTSTTVTTVTTKGSSTTTGSATTTSATTITTTGSSTTTTSKATTTGTTTTSNGKLPQTGQLWWPVPVMGAAGMVLFAVGWRLNRRK